MEIRKLIAAAALGTGAVFTSMAFAADDGKPKQSVGEYASDATVTTKVKAAFVADKQLSALEIAVETTDEMCIRDRGFILRQFGADFIPPAGRKGFG